ncbi:MAG: ATP-grasp domain-containing protein [Candidatus Marithrix sp.]
MNILLTSVGRRSYLVKYFKDAIGSNGKIYASNSEQSIALKKADHYFISPLVYDDNYVSSIVKYCVQEHIETVLSLFDIDLLVLAKNENMFSTNGIQLILAPYNSIMICNDKWLTYEFLSKNNITTPKTYLTINNTISAIEIGNSNYPVVIKPRWGMASLGIYYADNENELKVLYKKSKQDIFNSYMKYESSLTEKQPIIMQEKIIGKEFGIDVLNNLELEFVKCFVKQKVTMRAGETDIGLTVNADKFKKISMLLSKKIGHKGILSVDCFMVNNDIYVTEMNCRISGHYPISHVAGFNFPKVLIRWLQKKYVDESLLSFKENIYITKELVPVVLDSYLE